MLKRILQLIVVMLIAAQGVMAQTVQIASVTQPPGDIQVQVDMLNFTGSNGSVAAITLNIEYNSDLMDYNGITNTQLTGSWQANASNNVISIVYTDMSGAGFDINGKLLDLVFHYKGGFTSDLTFDTASCEIANSSLGTISANYVSGSVTQSTAVGSVSMSNLTDTIGDAVSMPVTMQGSGFTAVSSFTFVVEYDESQLNYTGVTGSVVTGLTANASNGVITIEWTGTTAGDFSAATHLFDIEFTYLWGSADVTFAPGCEVDDSGLNPLAVDYTNGNVSSVSATRSLTIANVGATTDTIPVSVNVPVIASEFSADNVGAITLKYSYDDAKLTYRSYSAHQLSGWTVNNSTSGEVTFMWSSNPGSPILDDTLMELVFDLDPAGGVADVSFVGGTILKDDQSVTLPVEFSNGSIAGDISVSGQLTYNNDVSRLICTKNSSVTTVYLKKAADSSIAYSTTADTSGNFVFTSVAVGNYFLDASSTIDTKYGYDNTDAFLIYGTGSSMTGLAWKASDVNDDGFVDVTDAYIVYGSVISGNNRVTSWSIPDWVFENPVVTVSTGSIVQDFAGRSSGDANGDWVPVP